MSKGAGSIDPPPNRAFLMDKCYTLAYRATRFWCIVSIGNPKGLLGHQIDVEQLGKSGMNVCRSRPLESAGSDYESSIPNLKLMKCTCMVTKPPWFCLAQHTGSQPKSQAIQAHVSKSCFPEQRIWNRLMDTFWNKRFQILAKQCNEWFGLASWDFGLDLVCQDLKL